MLHNGDRPNNLCRKLIGVQEAMILGCQPCLTQQQCHALCCGVPCTQPLVPVLSCTMAYRVFLPDAAAVPARFSVLHQGHGLCKTVVP